MSYETYFELIKAHVAEGKTSGNDQSEKLINFTRLNFQRMKRVYKTTITNEEFHVLLHNAYTLDKTQSIQHEIKELIKP
ncbi:MAG: hypothetical protein KAQ62_17185 [Cyclobacteriaceae bacterium]|nr:hypothetical protein [Cyclobacteriaceae bacterium]MCK5468784.1 hypothetical protein [Cyclobacteriaceae bacterium]MCK5704102.1 hypothetical protein [Cyclobacteriaceae bacterium]